MPDETAAYLGDGAYVRIDVAGQIILFTSNGLDITNEVALDPIVLQAFLDYLNRHNYIREKCTVIRGEYE